MAERSGVMTYALKPTSNARPRPVLRPDVPEQAALEDLHRRLVRLAIKLIWNRDDAEDTVQEAFRLALTKGIEQREAHFGAWMFRTVGNLCLNHRRRTKPEPLADWIDPPDEATPEMAAQQVEQLARLREAMGRLPEQQRLALTLRTMEQMTYSDIAKVMQLSESAVRAHVHLGRRRLADWIGDDCGEARR